MEYRRLGETGLAVSAMGLGTEHLTGQTGETIAAIFHTALESPSSMVTAERRKNGLCSFQEPTRRATRTS